MQLVLVFSSVFSTRHWLLSVTSDDNYLSLLYTCVIISRIAEFLFCSISQFFPCWIPKLQHSSVIHEFWMMAYYTKYEVSSILSLSSPGHAWIVVLCSSSIPEYSFLHDAWIAGKSVPVIIIECFSPVRPGQNASIFCFSISSYFLWLIICLFSPFLQDCVLSGQIFLSLCWKK